MPRTSGTYSLPPSYKAVSGQNIKTEQHNPPLEDIAKALTDSLPRDGSAPMTGDLPMNGRKIIGIKAGTDAGDAVRRDQVTLYSAWLSAMAGLSFAADKIAYATGAGTAALTDLKAFGRSIIGAADAGEGRTALGLKAGSIAEKASKTLAEAGADNASYMTPLRTREAIAVAVGVGRTWQNVTGSRGAGVTYQNTTGAPITVSARVRVSAPDSSARIALLEGATSTIGTGREIAISSAFGLNNMANVSEVIPAGRYYRIDTSGAAADFIVWERR